MGLVMNYNHQISPVADYTFPYTLAFTQASANAKFKDDNTASGTDFQYAGMHLFDVVEQENFDPNDFLITFFKHPNPQKNVLYADNNRGLAIHALAKKDVGRFKIVSFNQAANTKLIDPTTGERTDPGADPTTIEFDKNRRPDDPTRASLLYTVQEGQAIINKEIKLTIRRNLN